MMQSQSESHIHPARSIALIGLMCFSLSSCCLFSPRKAGNDHHAAVGNQTETAVKAPIYTTAHRKHLILAGKRHF
jgi:hypothetical protein